MIPRKVLSSWDEGQGDSAGESKTRGERVRKSGFGEEPGALVAQQELNGGHRLDLAKYHRASNRIYSPARRSPLEPDWVAEDSRYR